ncbi:MAG: glycosyltransferase family 4 protein [candidate division Zixibacteria bacterium]|nr:glycosyltransferase family 4 protein [candidate division Zixibacteria bacterium]
MKRTLNILQLVNFRWYNACAHYAVALSSGLQKRGHRVILAGDRNSPPLQLAHQMGLEVFPDLYLSYQNPGRFFYNIKRLKDIIEQNKIDLVNAHQGAGQLYASLGGKLFKKRFILIRTRGDQRKPKNDLFNRWLNLKWTDGIITTAETLYRSYAEKFPLDKSRLINIPLGIDLNYFSPLEKDLELGKSLGISDGELVVGILGRLSPVKGHRYFIQAAAEVLKSFQHVKFLIAGEDAQVKSYRLKEWVKEMRIQDKFIFIGRVETPRKIISLMDIAVVASTGSETIARVALEYMALGKPVVGTEINAIPEVVKNGINGFIVRPEDSRGMAEAMLQLLEDKDKREKFGRASRDLVENEFSLDTFVSKTEEFYFRFFKGN